MSDKAKPCDACPWARASEPGALGGSPPETYIGQAVLSFWLPCHASPKYAAKESDVNIVHECAGAAIFRANIDVKYQDALLRLPADKDICFASLAEFYAHHKNISLEEAKEILTDERVAELARKELYDANVKVHLKRKKIQEGEKRHG